jgi:origin recognition complex subunit 2
MDFASHIHLQSAKPPKIVIVNGYTPGLTLADIFKAVIAALLGPKSQYDLPSKPESLASIAVELLTQHPSPPLCLIIHSLDHPNLRTKAQTYPLLAGLASHRGINLIATCDNPNFGLLWNSALLQEFRWLYHDATTFEPYVAELDVVEEVNQLLGRGRRRLGGKDGVAYVLKSLPENARNLFRILVAEQLALMDAEPSSTVAGADVNGFDDDILGAEDEETAAKEQGTPSRRGRGRPQPKAKPSRPVIKQAGSAPEGVEYRTLYNKAVEEFVCSSELSFRTLLKEFHDHQMIESRKDAMGTERLVVPFGKEELEGVLEELI